MLEKKNQIKLKIILQNSKQSTCNCDFKNNIDGEGNFIEG